MADTSKGADSRSEKDGEVKRRSAEKRLSTESTDNSAPTKKISMGIKPAANQKISFNLGSPGLPKSKPTVAGVPSKAAVAPIKMSLNTVQKDKDVAPIVQKSALAAKVFDDSDDSDGEEMPPEAKMRMKNIGRDTPTASGPNSYGKGKQGFIDRHKIIEKQLKEEMERVSGDNERPVK
ncbi:PEST proteolytic signal-containing nuclear protein-like [Physella acuta]|uniref:PEST proteolytic signal-containing nuclear protein-like n=1 Tax=Physella acuta TaxID=109671 RepID=UPI0027DE206E|nr:PEST proteolytic signal-containing nuclear protein-like [Physella acuta]